MRIARFVKAVWFCLLLCAAGSLRAEEPADSKAKAEPDVTKQEPADSNAKAEPDVAKAVEKGPVPVIYDDFSDGKLWERTGSDPWGRKLPSWTFEIAGSNEPDVLNATKGYISYEYKDYTGISIPSKVAYGTWEWKYRFPQGTIPFGSTGREDKCIYVFFIRNFAGNGPCRKMDTVSGEYWFARAAERVVDGHAWFARTAHEKDDEPEVRQGGKGEVHLLHNRPGNYGVGMCTDKLWHTVRITRDRQGRFTIYHDERVIGDPPCPLQIGGYECRRFFKDVPDNTWRESASFMIYMKNSLSPGQINLDDIKIYDKVIPARKDVPLRELWAVQHGADPEKLPSLVNYASRKAGATSSRSNGERTIGERSKGLATVNMIDGITTDYDSNWGFTYAKWPNYLVVTLKEPRTISEIYVSLWDTRDCLLRPYALRPRRYDFEVEVSTDGKSWTNFTENRAVDAGIRRVILPATKVRMIRMRGKHLGKHQTFSVVELEAYGPAAK